MKIYLTRHGQTRYNKDKLMQGLTDEPLNETGIKQAMAAREFVKDIKFDAVYASPLDRAVTTASIIGSVDKNEVIKDERIIEVDFGEYELLPYAHLGFAMTAYWLLPELIPEPKNKGVEGIKSMVERSSSFLSELEKMPYENVLVVCHGGIIRALCGYLENRKNGIKWRPKPYNCEIRVYESINGKRKFIESYRKSI
jgi:alpha-ribazole phosphatase/probable phosphoglycerate mutase